MTSSRTTMRGVRLSAPGPVDNLRLTTLPLPPERDGWVRICVEAFGLNRSELKVRLGLSAGVSFPRVPGIEAVGTVDAAPPGSGLAPGQKVVAMMGDMGRTYDGCRDSDLNPCLQGGGRKWGPAAAQVRSNICCAVSDRESP